MDAVLDLMPEEERIQYSAMTGQSLFYLGETDLQHRILAIAEEEGVRQAAYALTHHRQGCPCGRALRGLDGSSAGAVRESHRDHGAVVRDGRVPLGLPSACGRRQTRRDIGMGVGCCLADSRL